MRTDTELATLEWDREREKLQAALKAAEEKNALLFEEMRLIRVAYQQRLIEFLTKCKLEGLKNRPGSAWPIVEKQIKGEIVVLKVISINLLVYYLVC